MTDQPNTTTPTVVPAATDPTTDEQGAGGRRRDPAGEAQQRRLQLREAESERDALMLERTDLRRQAIESLLQTDDLRGDGSHAATLHDSADLWGYFAATPDQFYVDGVLDREALADFIAEQGTARPHMVKAYVENVPPHNPTKEALDRQMSSSAVSSWAYQPKSDWQAALQD